MILRLEDALSMRVETNGIVGFAVIAVIDVIAGFAGFAAWPRFEEC